MPHDYGLGPGFEPNHVDRKSLYVNLEERIKYLHNFLEWTNGTSRGHHWHHWHFQDSNLNHLINVQLEVYHE